MSLVQAMEHAAPIRSAQTIHRRDLRVQRGHRFLALPLLAAEFANRPVAGRRRRLSAEVAGLAQAVADKLQRVIAAVEVVGEVLQERVKRRAMAARLGAARDELGGRPEQVHRMNPHPPGGVGVPERPGHRQRRERLDHPLGMLALGARPKRAVGGEIPFSGVEIHHDENPAKEPEQLVELGENLLQEEVVGFDHKNRARRAFAELAGEHVVAEIHPAVEPRRVHQHGGGLGQARHRQLDVDAPDGLREGGARIERLAPALGGTDLLHQSAVRVGHHLGEQGFVAENRLAPVVARGRKTRFLAVPHKHQAGVTRQRSHLADVRPADRVHQRALAALERTENQQVSLLIAHFVGERAQMSPDLVQRGEHLPECVCAALKLFGGCIQRVRQGLESLRAHPAEPGNFGLHGRTRFNLWRETSTPGTALFRGGTGGLPPAARAVGPFNPRSP